MPMGGLLPYPEDEFIGAPAIGPGPFATEPAAAPESMTPAAAPPTPAAPFAPQLPDVNRRQPQDWNGVLRMALPLILGSLGTKYAPHETAAAIGGFLRGVEMRRERQEHLQDRELRRKREAAEFATRAVGELAQLDPAFHPMYAEMISSIGRDAYGLDLRPQIDQVTAQARTTKEKSQAATLVERLDKAHPGVNWSAEDETGTPRPRAWWVTRAGSRPGLDASGKALTPGAPKPDAPNTSEEHFYATFAQERGYDSFRAMPSTLQKEARRQWAQADNDPILDEMRRMRAENLKRQVNSPDLSPAQFNMANKLADDFARDSKDFVARGQSYGTVLAASKDATPAGDLSLIFAYMKMLDPGSVVREGEFATAQNAAAVPDRVRNLYNRVVDGTRLTPEQRADFTNQAKNVYSAAQRRQTAIVQTYTDRAQVANVPANLVVMDYGAGVEPAGPRVGERRMINGQLGEWDGKGWKPVGPVGR